VSDALGVLETDVAAQQDPFNNRNNRAVSAFDVPQRFVLSNELGVAILEQQPTIYKINELGRLSLFLAIA